MSSMSGYVNYIEYVAGVDKGDVKEGQMFNSPFALGNYDPNYTSAKVVETAPAGEGNVTFTPAWTPVIEGTVEVEGAEGWTQVTAVEGVYTVPAGARVRYIYNNVVVPQNSLPTIKAEMKSMPLLAKARRIAVFYSQMAAFQA